MATKAPFNVSLLQLTPAELRLLDSVSVLDIFDAPQSSDFHSKGLFSTEIFGRVGEEERDRTFAYIPLKNQILHPFIYDRLEKIRKFYIQIMLGERYAKFDPESKDFVESNIEEGETGYAFFMRHWKELVIPKGESEIRQQRIELINQYREKALLRNVYVLPAGLRDAEVDAEGRVDLDEINEHYQRLIGISRNVPENIDLDDDTFDSARRAQQKAFNAVYHYLEGMLTNKKGFIQSKWGKRNVTNGTRNVITAMDIAFGSLDQQDQAGPDDTAVGLWQLSRGIQPITIHALRESILQEAFGYGENIVYVVDPKTYERKGVKVSPQTYDRWTTAEGLEKVIASQSAKDSRAAPVWIEDNYLGLVYKPKDRKVFRVFNDINDLPEELDRKDVYPLTLMELIYLSNYKHWNDTACVVTRYPVSGEGSTYVSKVFVRTTTESEVRVELNENFDYPEDDEANTALVYPIFDPPKYIDTTMVHPHRLVGLNGDYDGDTVSVNFLFTEEGIGEVDRHLQTREAHVDPSGGLRADAQTDTVALVMHNMTSPAA